MINKFRLAVLIIGIAIVVAGGRYLYANWNQSTPQNALQTVEDAITNHSKEDFYKAVNLDSVLATSYDGVVDSLTDSDKTMTAEAREAIKNFTQMLKSPLLISMKAAIETYIETGNFHSDDNAGISELVGRIGIDRVEYRGVENVRVNPKDDNEAVARIKIYQPEIQREFIIEAVMRRDSEEQWKVVGLKNVKSFIESLNEVRRSELDRYLEVSAEIAERHDTTIREAEQRYATILSLGNIGQDRTRSDLRNLLLDVVKKDWEVRKQELFGLSVPHGAETLQNLRLKICDLEIEYADEYARWMDDRKSATLKSAEDKKRQADTLLSDVTAIARRMAN